MTGIAGILLAAGEARRFGGHKLLARLPDGQPVALAAGRSLTAVSLVSESVAVVRPDDRELTVLFNGLGLRVIDNPNAPAGISASIALAVSSCADASGWVVALADMPWIQPETIASVAMALCRGASIAAPTYRGQRGHPVGFAARWRSRLVSLQGDMGARGLLEEAGPDLLRVATMDRGILEDVDVPADLVAGFWRREGGAKP